jgi:type II secretory ATPase GspE/PulE/Tfp pilus assembly ATPase PilB-like protein
MLRASAETGPFFRGTGCENCRMTGYRGRTGLFELLILRSELRDLILNKRPSTEIKALAVRHMRTIGQDGLLKAKRGVTSLDEVMRVAMSGELGEE